MGRYQRDFGAENIILDHAKYRDLGRGRGQRECKDKGRERDANIPEAPGIWSFRKPGQ